MKPFIVNGFDYEKHLQEGNSFLIGNGHLGYRGTLEEYGKKEMGSFNLVGVYDQYQDKWRESLNMPNPLSVKAYVDDKEESVLTTKPKSHQLSLSLEEGVLSRKSEFEDFLFSSERFLSSKDDSLLCSKIEIKAKKNVSLSLRYGIDTDIYEINGPHFKKENISEDGHCLYWMGTTNEEKILFESVSYLLSKNVETTYSDGFFISKANLKRGESLKLEIFARVNEQADDFSTLLDEDEISGFETRKKEHVSIFKKKFHDSLTSFKGDEDDFPLAYSIYQLRILADEKRCRGIPARGVSGEVYKGASFWDSEIFLLPFFALTDPAVAKNLLLYRIKTLPGAKSKAESFGYKGAFYAWESQEDGVERCSKYNVTDPVSGEKIRTYFNEKQIHISADIPFAFEKYFSLTGDYSLLDEGAKDVLCECALFFLSYSIKGDDGLYHLNDVIGPDEYHERVNDNAFTNYMAHNAAKLALKYLDEDDPSRKDIEDFEEHVYLPKPNEKGIIEQFSGYFKLKESTPDILRKSLRNPQDYWGGKNGVATPTQVIKQADVVAMLALLKDDFSYELKKANYDYYFPRTEHGSSLSASMYSLLGIEVKEENYALKMYQKSAMIDIVGSSKEFAGGIYIGGTHPAANAGAYIAMVYGFAGCSVDEKHRISFQDHLPKGIDSLEIHYYEKGKRKVATLNKNSAIFYKEEQR